MTSLDVVALPQCAALARRHRADDELVMAARLHDVGHLAALRRAVSPASARTLALQGAALLERWLGRQSPCGSGAARA